MCLLDGDEDDRVGTCGGTQMGNIGSPPRSGVLNGTSDDVNSIIFLVGGVSVGGGGGGGKPPTDLRAFRIEFKRDEGASILPTCLFETNERQL